MKTIEARKVTPITTTGSVDSETIMSKPTIEIKTKKELVFEIAQNNLVICKKIKKASVKKALVSQETSSTTRVINIPRLSVSAGYNLATKCSLWERCELHWGSGIGGSSNYIFPSVVAVVKRESGEWLTVSQLFRKHSWMYKKEEKVLVYADKSGKGVCMTIGEMKAKYGRAKIFSTLVYGCCDKDLPQEIYILN